MSSSSFRDEPPRNGESVPGRIPQLGGELAGDSILVPLLTSTVPAVVDQVKVATILTRATDASLSTITSVSISDRTLETLRGKVTDVDEEALLERIAESTTEEKSGVLRAGNLVKRILKTIDANDIDTVVLPGRTGGSGLGKEITERIAANADCDVVVVNGRSGYDEVASILLAVASGPHSGLATGLARRIAADRDAWIDVLHVIDADASERDRERANELTETAYRRIARPETTTTWTLEADDAAEAILEQSRCYDLTVVGAPTKSRLRQFIYGSTNRTIRDNAQNTVISAQNNRHYTVENRNRPS